jgi:hypothetical protein
MPCKAGYEHGFFAPYTGKGQAWTQGENVWQHFFVLLALKNHLAYLTFSYVNILNLVQFGVIKIKNQQF